MVGEQRPLRPHLATRAAFLAEIRVSNRPAVPARPGFPAKPGIHPRCPRSIRSAGETLFIDARKLAVLIDRVHRELTDEEIARIAGTYHAWCGDRLTPSPSTGEGRGEGVKKYQDIPGFCKSAKTAEIAEHGYVLTPGRYVSAEAVEDDDEPFDEKLKRLTGTLYEQFAESRKLEKAIRSNLEGLGYGG